MKQCTNSLKPSVNHEFYAEYCVSKYIKTRVHNSGAGHNCSLEAQMWVALATLFAAISMTQLQHFYAFFPVKL